MANKIKVENCLVGGAVYLNCEGLSKDGRTIKIPSRTGGKGLPFVMISEDELSWLMTNSKAFEKGSVRVINEGNLPADIVENLPQSVITFLDIPEILNLPVTKFVKKLQEIETVDFLKEMIVKADELDKGSKTISAINKRIEEIAPKFDVSPVVKE